jgi:hypothetical protein
VTSIERTPDLQQRSGSRPQGAARADAERPPRRPPTAVRRAGYVVGAAVNALFLWLVNVEPGWRWFPFVSEDFTAVLGWVNVSLMVGVVVNVVYVVVDPPWLKRLGDAVTAAVAFVVLLRLTTVFPFDLGSWSGWETPLRVVLVLGCVGTAIGAVASLAEAMRLLVRGAPGASTGTGRWTEDGDNVAQP